MDAIIFDVDGTLWDSAEEVSNVWILAAKKYGAPYEHITAERLYKEFGKTEEAIATSLFPNHPVNQAVEIVQYACNLENEWLRVHKVSPYDGVPEIMKTLSSYLPLFIVSNCQAGYIEIMLETTGMSPYITDHLCPGDTGLAKAANIRAIVDKYHLNSPVYVGDTAGDLAASREAGAAFVFASYGFGSVNDYDAVIDRPLDLLKLVSDSIK